MRKARRAPVNNSGIAISRIDYILLSPGMACEWIRNSGYVLKIPDWGVASDHRALLATFEAEDK